MKSDPEAALKLEHFRKELSLQRRKTS